jgi:hypothetical protein
MLGLIFLDYKTLTCSIFSVTQGIRIYIQYGMFQTVLYLAKRIFRGHLTTEIPVAVLLCYDETSIFLSNGTELCLV